MDSFNRKRVLELREEIATLQRDNESYEWKKYHSTAEFNINELRRLRLLERFRGELIAESFIPPANRRSHRVAFGFLVCSRDAVAQE